MRFILLILVLLIFPFAQVRAEFDESNASGEYPESTQERRKTRGFGSILGTNPDTGGLQVFGKTIGKTEKKQVQPICIEKADIDTLNVPTPHHCPACGKG